MAPVAYPILAGDTRQQVFEILRQLIGTALAELWFSQPGRLEVHGDGLRVTAASGFELKRIESRFGDELREAASQCLGASARVTYCQRAADRQTAPPAHAAAPPADREPVPAGVPSRRSRDLHGRDAAAAPGRAPEVRRGFRLADFIYPGDNSLLAPAIEQIFSAPGRFSPLLIHGPNGSGKTHLGEAVAAEFRSRGRNRSAVCISAEQFTNTFVDALRGGGLPGFRRKFRDLDLLVVDDIQFFARTRSTQSEFQYTLDHLARSGKQVLLTADRPVTDLVESLGDLPSRIAGGLVCPVSWVTGEERSRIVERFAAERGLELAPGVAAWIGASFPGDARRLSGAVNRILAASLGRQGPVDRQVAEAAVADLLDQMGDQASLARIEEAVCDCLGVTGSDLRSARRTRRLSTARMLAMWLSRKHTASALSEIGGWFGGRSHSTVVAAQRRVEQMLEAGERVEMAGRSCPVADAICAVQRRIQAG